jgi:DNA-binding NtrC family response regulator
VIPVRIPPLRERLDDIPLLAYRFAVRAGMDMGKEITAIAPDAIALLKSYDWPGNVRELQHAVERAVILSADRVLRASSFEGERFLTARDEAATPASASPTNPATNAITTAEGEKDANPRGPEIVLRTLNIGKAESVLIEHALAATGNNRTRAAALLGISVRTLRNKLNGHRPPRPRPSDVPPSASGGSSR